MEKGANYQEFIKENPNYLPPVVKLHPSWEKFFKDFLEISEDYKKFPSRFYKDFSFCFLVSGLSDLVIDINKEEVKLAYFYKGDYLNAKKFGKLLLDNEDKGDIVEYTGRLHDYVFMSMFVKDGYALEHSNERISVQKKYKNNLLDKQDFYTTNSGYAYNNHALTLILNRDLEEAIKSSNKALIYESYNPFAHYVRALILNALDNIDEAKKEFELSKNHQKYFYNHNCIKALINSGVIKIPDYLIHPVMNDNYLLDFFNENEVCKPLFDTFVKRDIIIR